MANTTSGTATFDKTFSIDEIIEEAFERCGLRGVSGYQLKTARRSLNILFQEWGNRGLHYWEVGTLNLTLTQGEREFNFYRYPSDMPTTGATALQKSNGLNTTLNGAIVLNSTHFGVLAWSGGARTRLAPRAVGTFGIGGASRGARASPRLTRRRARPATLRSPLALPQPIVVVRGSAGR